MVLFLGIYLPLHLYGGIGPMFEQIATAISATPLPVTIRVFVRTLYAGWRIRRMESQSRPRNTWRGRSSSARPLINLTTRPLLWLWCELG